MVKKFLFLISLFILANMNNIALSDILPLKKPSQTKEETQKKLLIDVLKPLPKPIEKTEVKVVEEKVDAKKNIKNQSFLAF
mgnify:CR=1 FL=1